MDIPAEIQIRATIQGGSVFYFTEESFTSAKPHYFVVLNKQPVTDDGLILICAVTLDTKVIERSERLGLTRETLIDVTPKECPFLTRPSLFNCNTVITKPLASLIDKLEENKLNRYGCVADDLLTKLRAGVCASNQVSSKVKKMLG